MKKKMSPGSLTIALVAGAAGLGWPSVALGQASADVTAQANVLAPISLAAERTLDFGDVFPGTSQSVQTIDATSGRWMASGELGAEVTLSFTLPTNLASGANTLPITFGASDAAHNTINDPLLATSFDPAAGTTTTLDLLSGELFIWIGGTVSPSFAQAAGLYSGTVTLEIDYTGN